jgi:hypothetical protein
MKRSHLIFKRVLALCTLSACVAVQAQQWQLEQQTDQGTQGPWQSSSVSESKPGMVRSVRVSEASPGVFSVMERTPFPNIGGNPCIGRTRDAHLAASGGRQVLTIAPAMRGCRQTRLVIDPDGSGWEEQFDAGQWAPTGARLVGQQQVRSSQPVPPAPAVATAAPPPVQPAPVAAAPAPAEAPASASTVAISQPTGDTPPRPDSPALAKNGHRRALVIGNDSYRYTSKLLNARADARAMGLSLERAGFEVTTRLDVDARGLRASLREFKASLEPGDEVIVFYSGHGVQIGGINYLLPVDIRGETEDQLRDDSVPLQRVLDDVSDRHARFMLAMVDACRDNPFKGSGSGRSLGAERGLAPTTAATGQMIIYSAGSGQRALDRLSPADKNPNGVFTRVFLREMETPGVPIDRVLRNVRNEVVRMARAVNHEQTPALYDQSVGDFYLRPTH